MDGFRKADGQKKGIEIKPFQPKNLGGDGVRDYTEVRKDFGSLSSIDPGGNPDFNLNPAAKKFLGVERQEKNHVESLVRAEVDSRVAQIREEACREGFESGRKDGHEQALAEHREKTAPLHEELARLIEGFEGLKKDLFLANEAFLVQLVFQVGKQVLLKELGADREYVKRLAAHVVEKVGAKDHIRVRISRKDAENLEEIKDFIKARIPDLRNLQIEPSDELPLGGCKVETDLNRINASVETQLQAVEKALGEQ